MSSSSSTTSTRPIRLSGSRHAVDLKSSQGSFQALVEGCLRRCLRFRCVEAEAQMHDPALRKKARGSASRKRSPLRASKPARGASPRAKRTGPLPRELEQRHLDLIGLCLIALGLYLGFVLYAGWDGGSAGSGIEVGLTWVVGAVAYAMPMLLAGLGLALVVRPLVRYPGAHQRRGAAARRRPAARVRRRDRRPRPRSARSAATLFDPDYFTAHGGAIGESLYWASTTLFQRVGAHIIALLLIVSGILLLSGRPLVSLIGSGAEAGRRAGERDRGASPGPPRHAARARASGERAGDGWTTTIYDGRRDAEPFVPTPTRTRSTSAPTALADEEAEETAADRRASRSRPRLRGRRGGGRTGRSRSGPRRRRGRDRDLADADGRQARRDHRVRGDRLPDAAAEAAAPRRRREGPRPRPPGHGADRAGAARGAQPLQDRGAADRHRHRPAREPLRAPARARHEGRQDRPAQGRPRLRARLDRHPHPRADPRQEGGRRRGPERAPQDGPPRRHLRRPPRRRLAAARLARQGHLRPGRLDGPGEDAARARRRHHRLGQVGLGQRDPHLDAAARLAERAAARPRRPQAGRAQPLRLDPAPADAGRHLAPGRRERAGEPRRRDGVALHGHGQGAGPQPRRAEQDPRQGRRGAAAAHPLRDRRARRPDDGRPGRGRGLDHPPGAEVARGRHPPAARHPAALDGRDHGHDQGQHPGADRVRGRLPDRLARDPRPGRRRVAARAWATCSSARSAPRSCSASRARS